MKRSIAAPLLLSALVGACGVIKPPKPPQPSPSPTAPPSPAPTPTPTPGPQPPNAITSLKVSANAPHCLERNGLLYQVAAYGNIVPAIPSHDWRNDVELLVQQGGNYARIWDKLSDHTVEWPWLKLANGKWDLSQKNPTYFKTMAEVFALAGSKGIVVEWHLFDRGLGGNAPDYKLYPWHPDRNVNGLERELPEGGLGTPDFYNVGPGTKTRALQEQYVRWCAEFAKAFPNVIVEVENENRSWDANEGVDWFKRWAKVIREVAPGTLIAHNSLNLEVMDKLYAADELDVVNIHFGNDGNDPRVVDRYCRDNWSKRKPINIDEFANGLASPHVAEELALTLARDGCHFHFEDATAQAKPEVAAATARELISNSTPIPCQAGPTGPGPGCPKETKRGQSILYVNRQGQRVCTGNNACLEAMKQDKLKAGDNFVFDSTALEGVQRPIPDGCGTCAEKPTKWSTDMGGRQRIDGGCGFELWPARSGVVISCDSNGQKCVTKSYRLK